MEIDKIIEGLNSKRNTKEIGSKDFDDTNLSVLEKTFLNTYHPEKSLIVYGSLAPNAVNHSVVEHIKGNWQPGKVMGILEEKGWGADLGYYAFKHASQAEQHEIKAVILLSDELVANWQMLDEFEGDGYKRILAKYELENGQVGVGNIYAANEAGI